MAKNKYLSGNNGIVWLNGEKLGQLKSIEAKVTGDFEEINLCGENATQYHFQGWNGEGTLVLQKIDSAGINLLAEAMKDGDIPECKIITKLTEKSSGKSERVAINDVIFTEFDLAKFEGKSTVEEELPFKFSDYDVIEKI